jgi:hypothetical protein
MQRNGSKLIKNKGLISYTNMFECKINKKKIHQNIKIKHEIPNPKTNNLKELVCLCNMNLKLVF